MLAAQAAPDDRDVEVAVLQHRLQRREDLLVGEVAGGAEEDERIGVRFAAARAHMALSSRNCSNRRRSCFPGTDAE
jgi:hypothetical protein